ncbi:uncharacterized protein ACLA_074080 [Aspergillus clavatus NRRL 1]|uniref:Uncharacterized protein n=1 Tax=Aspergillus clavatus (strain ATCC 1007 / CBS 513.65 / DSM 816 / NCTC 3887 / NRRL 1 / QM 1276 / 107) TaxID=344612 RepID=A1C7K0_ASPCL|nr:uncharacterized protein ACLA_074080 [Aspergillus clavatus NRRL 1]EAW14371.1 hypothetical protein ACLA_074080 [Aspergillus clavatus NRRL 1]
MGGSSRLDMHLSEPGSLLVARPIDGTVAGLNTQKAPATGTESDRPKHTMNYPPPPVSQPAMSSTEYVSSKNGSRSDLPDIAIHPGSFASRPQPICTSPKHDSAHDRSSQAPSEYSIPDGQSRTPSLSLHAGQERGGSSSGFDNLPRFVAGRKRTATGDIKLSKTSIAPARAGVDGSETYHAGNAQSSSHGSRIAAVN